MVTSSLVLSGDGAWRRSSRALIPPRARSAILTATLVEFTALVGVGVMQSTFEPLIAVIIGAMGLGLMLFATSPARRFYTSIVFAIWFNLGCVLSYADLLLNETLYRSHPSPATGGFAFTSGEMWQATLYLAMGAAGVVFATLLAEAFIARDVTISPRTFKSAGSAGKIVVAWILLGVLVSMLLIHFQVGRTGLVNRTELPFRLNGLLSYTRTYFFPASGLLLVDMLLNGRYLAAFRTMLVGLLIVGLLGSVAALSRGYFGFLVLSLGIYLLLNADRHRIAVRTLPMWGGVGAILLLVCIVAVNSLRERGFSGEELGISSTLSVIQQSRAESVGVVVSDVINLAVGRVGGLQELLGTLSAPQAWLLENPWKVFVEDSDVTAWLQQNVLGGTMYRDDIVGFGYSFSLFGTLSLSGSLAVVLMGTFVFVAALLLMEESFFRLEAPPVALAMAIYVGFQAWGFANKTICANLVGIALITYLTLGRLLASALVRRAGDEPANAE